MTSSSSMDSHLQEILGPDPTHFETLISNLMKPSNEQRSEAESRFILCKQTDPNTLVEKLVHLLESPCSEARAMSATLLRNLLQDELPLWNSLLDSTRSRLKSGLLKCVVNEQNKWAIRKLSDTISVLAAKIRKLSDSRKISPNHTLLADNDWPELMPFMFDRVASEDFWLQESALLIFAQLAQYVGDSLRPHITLLHGVFMKCLGNVGSADVRIAALSAVIYLIQCLESSIDMDRFQDLLPRMMHCLTEVLNGGNEATAQEALVLLIELAETEPGFFREYLVEVVGRMLQIAETESLEEETKYLAIEFVITMAEARERVPGMMRKFLPLISGLFAILMRMLLDLEDESGNNSVGQECLRRLAIALGPNTIFPVAYEQLSEYLAAPDHEKHVAALVALLHLLANGCYVIEIPILEQVVTMVLISFQDPHPHVRWFAINAIEVLSAYLGQSLQVQYHDRVLRALAFAPDVQNPQVQAHAVSFVLKFSSHCRPDILPPYLDEILNKLIGQPLTESGPNIRFLKLANSLEESTAVEIRATSAIQLGEMFEEPLAALTLGLVRRKLLTCVEKEDNRIVTKSLCRTIATFFNVLCIKTGWPELFSFVNQWASGDNDILKEAAMLILGPLRFSKNHPISLKVYYECLENKSAHIRIAAFGAAIGYIQCTHRVMDVDLVPVMTRVLTEGQEVTTQEALKLLIEWAHQKHPCRFSGLLSESYDTESYYTESYDTEFYDTKSYDTVWLSEFYGTKLLRHPNKDFSGRQLVRFVSGALKIAKSRILKKETRYLAIDFVITLGEGMLSNRELMINELFEILMSDINEAASHWAENEDDDAGESSNFSVLLKFLDRLAFRLDKDSVAWPKLEQYLDASEWRKRVIAINILALARISKVYLKETKNNFDQLVTKVSILFQDSHPRVRMAAINATTGQLSTDLDPDLQLQYHRGVLPALATAIYDDPDPRVRLAAINATGQLSTNLDPNSQLEYDNLVLSALTKAICDFQYPQVQEHAASAMINISNNKNIEPDILKRCLSEAVSILLEFLCARKGVASDQTRILAIENLLKQLRANLPHGTWVSTMSSLRPDHQEEFMSIVAHR